MSYIGYRVFRTSPIVGGGALAAELLAEKNGLPPRAPLGLYPVGWSLGARWEPGWNEAQCFCVDAYMDHAPDNQDVAGSLHRCGFWAFHSLTAAVIKARNRPVTSLPYTGPAPDHVVAVVAGAGRMTRHRDGWRAQRARVVAIAHGTILGLREIVEGYGVPLVPVDDLEHVAREHGDPMPSAQDCPHPWEQPKQAVLGETTTTHTFSLPPTTWSTPTAYRCACGAPATEFAYRRDRAPAWGCVNHKP